MAGRDDENIEVDYRVVINDEEQWSIWPSTDPVPAGWRENGPVGPKADCLAYIDEHWTDMRPLSLRRAMEAGEQPLPSGSD